MVFSTTYELRLHEGYAQIEKEIERKRRESDPTFSAADSEQFSPVSYMFKVMPEFSKETHFAKQMLNVR